MAVAAEESGNERHLTAQQSLAVRSFGSSTNVGGNPTAAQENQLLAEIVAEPTTSLATPSATPLHDAAAVANPYRVTRRVSTRWPPPRNGRKHDHPCHRFGCTRATRRCPAPRIPESTGRPILTLLPRKVSEGGHHKLSVLCWIATTRTVDTKAGSSALHDGGNGRLWPRGWQERGEGRGMGGHGGSQAQTFKRWGIDFLGTRTERHGRRGLPATICRVIEQGLSEQESNGTGVVPSDDTIITTKPNGGRFQRHPSSLANRKRR